MRRTIGVILAGFVILAVVFVITGLVYEPDPSPLRLARKTVTVGGTRVSYHQKGRGQDVVLVHGGMGSAEDFEPVLDRLAVDFRVTAIDRPGFGLSGARGDDPTYPGNARLVAGAVRALALARPVVVGHSHGGGVALAIAEDHPDVPGALVLLAPAAYPLGDDAGVVDRLGAIPFLGEGMMAWLAPWVAPKTIAAILERMIGPDSARVPADFVADRQRLFSNPRSLAVHSRQQVSDKAGLTTIAARLGAVQIPSIILACAQDPEEGHGLDSRRLARELPGSGLRWIEGCGHYVQYAEPDRVIEAVREMAHARPAGGSLRPVSPSGPP